MDNMPHSRINKGGKEGICRAPEKENVKSHGFPPRLWTRLLTVSLLIFAMSVFLAGCADSDGSADSDDQISVVCTAFPLYDWVTNIVGDNPNGVQVTLLNSHGTDMHSFQPSASDMIQIAGCDLFVYVGGFSESWADAALESSGNSGSAALALLDFVDKKEELLTEGMTIEAGERIREKFSSGSDNGTSSGGSSGSSSSDGDSSDGDNTDYDEHIWLSLRCAADACTAITDALCRIDESNSTLYEGNLQIYLQKLEDLDRRYCEVIADADFDTILVADRFPFRYMADDYGLNYFAAFSGCSAETEASFDTIIFLSEKLSELNLPAMLLTESGERAIADTIIQNSGMDDVPILTLNSMQQVTSADIDSGVTYLSLMEQNLSVLASALSSD